MSGRVVSGRDDDTRLRNRRGQYVAECDCPEGCACDGHGCPCGTDKRKTKPKPEGATT